MPFSDWNEQGRTYHLDMTGRILGTNQAASRKFDSRGRDLIGKTIYDILQKDVADNRMELIAEVGRTHKTLDIAFTSEGHQKHTIIIPIFDDSGEVIQVIAFVSDIPEPKRDVLFSRMLYAWSQAKLSAKIITLVGLWFAGLVSKKMFVSFGVFLVFGFMSVAILSENHAMMIINSYLAGGAAIFTICGTILRYFIR